MKISRLMLIKLRFTNRVNLTDYCELQQVFLTFFVLSFETASQS